MLEALSAFVGFVSSLIQGVISFFQMLTDAVTSFLVYIASLPSWLTTLFVGITTILLVRFLIDR